MTKDTFGESLKREREMRGVTLEEISAATRIATRFLQAIENESWDQLPGGVFNRGFVRAVARYLGLDEENIVAEYTLAVGDRQPVPVWTGSPPAVAPEQPWLAWIITLVVIVLLLVGGWFGTKRALAWLAARRATRAAAVVAAASPSTSPAPPADSQPPAIASATTDNPAPATDAPTATSTAASAAADAPPITASDSPSTQLFELKIVAERRTKVTVVADKDVVYDGNMKAGENHFFEATDHFQVSAKDAGVLRMEVNGKPVAPIGPAGRSGKVTLTRDALKGAPGGRN
jgi:cytoskeleton protein RodZ